MRSRSSARRWLLALTAAAASVLAALAVAALAPATAHAGPVRGRVLVDRDGSGTATAADEPLAGAVVGFDDESFSTADAAGRFGFEAPEAGLVWVRVPDGFRPGPVWAAVPDAGADDVTLLVTPHPVRPPLRFVHAADTHLGQASVLDAARALDDALGGDDPPHFAVITGDVTQNGFPVEIGAALALVDGLAAPLVTTTGNHDILDKASQAWRRGLGPTAYSFDAGGVHFVVVDGDRPLEARLAFLARDAALSPAGMPRFAFLHYPLTMPYDQRLYDALVAAGVTHVFTGHYHANRTIDFGGLVEHNVQPLVMGGMPLVPAGYQQVTVGPGGGGGGGGSGGDGGPGGSDGVDVRVDVRFVSDDGRGGPLAAIVYPRGTTCRPPGRFEGLVAVADAAEDAEVFVSLDGGEALRARRRGGLSHSVELRVDRPGLHLLVATISRGGRVLTRRLPFCVDRARLGIDAPAPLPGRDWPQLGGGPARGSAQDETVAAPLELAWATPVGGHVVAPPVHAGGRVFVAVTSFGGPSAARDATADRALAPDGDGTRGGLVALDARTGRRLWAARDDRAVAGSPVVVGERVIVSGVDGVVRAYAAATGAALWRADLGEGLGAQSRQLFAGPVADGARVYAGHMYRFVALDAATGERLWAITPSTETFVSLSRSTPAVAGGAVYAIFGHGTDGFAAHATDDGAAQWRLRIPLVRGMVAPPLVAGDALYLGASDGSVLRVDAGTGRPVWRRVLGQGAEYAFWLRSAPALARGQLVVASQMGPLVALDAATGAMRWAVFPPDGPLHPVHYGVDGRGATAGPVITGELVWAAGDDGVLRAIELDGGRVAWSVDLGAPLLGGLAPAATVDGRGALYVAGFDGVVRGLVGAAPAPGATPAASGAGQPPAAGAAAPPTGATGATPAASCQAAPASARAAGAGHPALPAVLIFLILGLAWVWKSHTRGVRLTRSGYAGVHQDSHAHRAPR